MLGLALVAALAVLGSQLVRLSDPYRTVPDDFISSWAAGRLVARGDNPYDPRAVLAVQRTANWPNAVPYRVWYPPWAMPILAAFGVAPYAWGRLAWYVTNFAATLVAVRMLWRQYGGPERWSPALFPLLFTFWPAVIDLRTGQISALVTVGLAGFLFFAGERRWMVAGACLPLVAIKPQLLHLFWLALALWMLRERRWDVLLGVVAVTIASTAVAVALDRGVVTQFLYMMRNEAPQAPASTLGTAARMAVAGRAEDAPFWLQFLPPALSLVWFVPYWLRRRDAWEWREEAPIIVLVSLVTTAYGWIYDDMVLLVPIVQIGVLLVARPLSRAVMWVVIGYIALNGTILAMNVAVATPFTYVWVPLAFALWWIIARTRVGTSSIVEAFS